MAFKPNRITDNSGGVAGDTLAAAALKQTVIIPMQLLDLVNSGAWTIALPFAFTILSALFRTGKPASTAAKAATITLSTSAGSLTGGVMALTSANQNTTGGSVAASAVSGANASASAGGTIIATASSVTAFVEGDGWVEVTVRNDPGCGRRLPGGEGEQPDRRLIRSRLCGRRRGGRGHARPPRRAWGLASQEAAG